MNKTERKPSKNNGKGRKMAVARKGAAGARHKTALLRTGTAKAVAPRPVRGKTASAPPALAQPSAAAGDDTVVVAL